MKKISFSTIRYYLDDACKWYLDECEMPDGMRDVWLGHEDYGIQEYLFGDTLGGHLQVEPLVFWAEIVEYWNRYCDKGTELPAFN